MAELAVFDNDPTLYLFTSLTAGSSHIVTATSRIETILRANKIPFKGVDTATDDLARKLFQRRASGKKLPLLVKEGYVLGDLEQIEEWNEYDELHEALGASARPVTIPAKPSPAAAAAAIDQKTIEKENAPQVSSAQNLAIRQMGAEAAKIAASKKHVPGNISTTNPLLTEKVNSPASVTPKSAGLSSPTGLSFPRISPLSGSPANSFPNLGSPANSFPNLGSRSSSSERRSFAGADIEEATAEEIRKIEQEEAIAEVSSSEEEDSEDERASSKSPSVVPKTTQARVIPNVDSPKLKAEKEESSEEDEDSSEEESEEDSAAKGVEKLKITDEQEKPSPLKQAADVATNAAKKVVDSVKKE